MESQFQKLEKIGRGAFAVVYKAKKLDRYRNPGDAEFFALKYIKIDDRKTKASEILEESIFLKKTDCSRIIKCYDTFLSNDGDYMILCLELCRGTLNDEIHQLERDPARCFKLFIQIAEGLNYIHQR